MRANLGKSTNLRGYTLKYDLCLSSEHYYDICRQSRDLINSTDELKDKGIDVLGSGHIADGSMHLKVTMPGFDDTLLQQKAHSLIDAFVLDFVKKTKGSISASHGVGLARLEQA
jgi:D-2-hydroxyglutarate dehydrogenase